MEKLDQNFNYIYEKLSSVEFDNATFKDKLEAYMCRSSERVSRSSEHHLTPNRNNKESADSLLDALGAFSSAGKFCYEDDCQ